MPLAINWNSKSAVKFEKKQSAKQKSAKIKQISIKTSNLQAFKKNRNSTKKQAQIRGKTARLAFGNTGMERTAHAMKFTAIMVEFSSETIKRHNTPIVGVKHKRVARNWRLQLWFLHKVLQIFLTFVSLWIIVRWLRVVVTNLWKTWLVQ